MCLHTPVGPLLLAQFNIVIIVVIVPECALDMTTRCINAKFIRPWMINKQERMSHALEDAASQAVNSVAQAQIKHRMGH